MELKPEGIIDIGDVPAYIKLLERNAKKFSWLLDQKFRIGFTNGCFDLFHVGHLRCLQGAAEVSEVLIVAVDSDANVRSLKGPDQPVIPELERAEIVAAVRGVTAVFIFDREEMPVSRMLREFKPDVYCKGTDYSLETLPEREVLEELDITFAAVGDPKDHSTQEILGKLNG